jgi:hypothetical protein
MSTMALRTTQMAPAKSVVPPPDERCIAMADHLELLRERLHAHARREHELVLVVIYPLPFGPYVLRSLFDTGHLPLNGKPVTEKFPHARREDVEWLLRFLPLTGLTVTQSVTCRRPRVGRKRL